MLLPSLLVACSIVRFNTFLELLGEREGDELVAAFVTGMRAADVCMFPLPDSVRPSVCGEVSIVVPTRGFCNGGSGGDADISSVYSQRRGRVK